jgi:hypothetical protein
MAPLTPAGTCSYIESAPGFAPKLATVVSADADDEATAATAHSNEATERVFMA